MTSIPDAAPVAATARPAERLLLGQVSLAHLVSHVHIMTVPALLPLLPGHFGSSFIEIGAALTLFNLVSLVVQAPMGFVSDRLGARRVLVAGLILGGLSFTGLAMAPGYGMLLAAMAAAGLANGVYHPANYALLARGIDGARMGKAFSLHTFAGYLGTAISPPLLLGAAALSGVSGAFAVAGALGLGIGLLLLVTGREPRQAPQPRKDEPDGAAARPPRARLLTGTVLALTAMFVLLNLSTGGIQSFSASALVMGYGIDLAGANAALTLFLFMSAGGVLAGGTLADRTSRHGLVAAGAFLATAVIATVMALTTPSVLVATLLLGLAGFLSGIITPSRDMLVRAAAPKGAEGIVFGIVSTGFNIGGLVGPLLYAALLDQGQPRAIFAAAAGFMVLTVVLTVIQDRRARG
ncbi:MFS transporter [Phreatobacter cathodiphilus]|uniref:MFS transporter n=1 Tax=Phreatobacter cathodiphilus TaxID=1868589 RepID=A0A2S0NE89_9HYPH|nr:MFS transporter [Phreatobacter cathodiphilus]AVO46484.1 MFS transporter [Phreatobacter cathodiphilus]